MPLGGSDALLGALGDRDLAPLPAPTGLDTLSGQLDATQVMPLPSQHVLGGTIQNEAPADPTSLRDMLVSLVAHKAAEGEGIGGLRYKLWFLILFGILAGLIVAGAGYSVLRSLPAEPSPSPVQQREDR